MTYQGCLYAGTSTITAVPLPSLGPTVRMPQLPPMCNRQAHIRQGLYREPPFG